MGYSESLHLFYMDPSHKETPKIAKMEKKKTAKTSTPPSWATDAIKVESKSFIEGRVVRVLNGLSNLNVLIPLTDLN